MATPPEAAASRQSNPAVIGLVIVLVLVLLAAVYFLFLRDGGDEVEAPPPTTAPAPTASPTVDIPEIDSGRGGNVRSFELFAARDPFKPLIEEGAGAGGTTETGTTGAGTDGATDGAADGATDGTTDGATDGTTNGGAGGTGGTAGGQTGGSREVEGRRVKLVDVFTEDGEKRAQVRVDGTVYTVSPGERFAENFQFVSASGQCATFLFGDDQFTLCEGQEILK